MHIHSHNHINSHSHGHCHIHRHGSNRVGNLGRKCRRNRGVKGIYRKGTKLSIRIWEFLMRFQQDFTICRENTGTNHQNREMKKTEAMCAKQRTGYLLILLIYPSLIFSSISPTFFVTEFPTQIFVLSCFSYFLLFVSVPKGKLLVNLGGVLSNCGSDSRVCCQTVFFNSIKKQKPKTNRPGSENQ